MSRRSSAIRRPTPEDPRFGSPVVHKFINGLLGEGVCEGGPSRDQVREHVEEDDAAR